MTITDTGRKPPDTERPRPLEQRPGSTPSDLLEGRSESNGSGPSNLLTSARDTGRELYADVAAFMAAGMPSPPQPQVCTRDDGNALFYVGHVNVLFGDPECGKTWIALAAIHERSKARARCLFVDIDHNGLAAVLSRLLALGVSVEYLTDPTLFRYTEPEDSTELLQVVADMRTWRPDVAVIDSIGELLPMFRASSNDPDDYTAANRAVLVPLARAETCVIAIDHLAKGSDSRAAGPTGTIAKTRAVTGASIRVTLRQTFVRGQGGACALEIHKDRHSGLREHCPPAEARGLQRAGVFTLAGGEHLTWNIAAPPMAARAVDVAQIMQWLDEAGLPADASDRKCEAARVAGKWEATRDQVRAAAQMRRSGSALTASQRG